MAWRRGLGDEDHGGVMTDDSPSSRRLDLLPQPNELQRRCELLAAMAIEVTPGDLVAEASRIGYPVDSAVSDNRKQRRWFKRS